MYNHHKYFCVPLLLLLISFLLPQVTEAQAINHQVSLPSGVSWCDDGMINGLFSAINTYRAQNGVAALAVNQLGMKDAEIRAVQVSAYMAANNPSSPNWDPHQGYDTTAASIGYEIVSENLAWATTDYSYIVNYVWQDTFHIAAMLAKSANVAGVSCVYANGSLYWTYEPGIASGSSPSPSPTPTPVPTPTPAPPTPPATSLDSEEATFLTLINNYRAQNGLAALKVSETLQTASQWMSTDMATNNYMSHTDSLNRSTAARLAAFGYTYSPWGENIAAGYDTAQDVFNGWLTACDPDASGNCTYSHRANMLGGNFVAIGIARAYSANSDYGWYWTTDFGGYFDEPLSGSPSSAPVISSFLASPSTIALGGTTTLSWAISGASTVSIDNGIGNITGTSVKVAPSATTTYHVTASNSAGTTTASATVAVNQPTSPAKPPTAPTLISAVAKSATEVDLTWTASADAEGIANYQVVRNGALFATVSGNTLTYVDRTVTANMGYTYSIKAVDSADLSSSASNAVAVRTPAVSSGSPGTGSLSCSTPGTSAFTGCYYNDIDWQGTPALVRSDAQISFDWTQAAPNPSVQPSNFSVKWQGNFNFSGGATFFTLNMTGAMALYVDGNEIVSWPEYPMNHTSYQTAWLTPGQHTVVVEYYNTVGNPVAKVSW